MPILVVALFMQTVIASIHSAFDCYKKKNANQVWHINLPNQTNSPIFQFNNNPFNAELAEAKEFLVALCVLAIPIICKKFPIEQKVAEKISQAEVLIITNFFESFINAVLLLIPPLLYFLKSRKLREFTFKFTMCKCNEL